MRLSKIKLGGFKSFVDPTTIAFPSSMTAVVGPNGCGKSNVIDAARWVMGESSAKHLRGGSMEDVIFNGSSARKPVGRAYVELVFDNSDGTLGGEYANYNEIALKRVVTRDGQSQYWLNGARCRRKDITDLFLGTGLGPRSYAIIEQGMISRFIEARPEDLRVYIEEAAGISKYKERRKETESSMRRTQENLERLDDIREEVAHQVERLQKQAETATRYQALAAEHDSAKATLGALRLRDLDAQAAQAEQARLAEEAVLADKQAELRTLEAELEIQRAASHEANEQMTDAQARFYEHNAAMARIEQAIEHAETLKTRQARELAEADAGLERLQTNLVEDEAKLSKIDAERSRLQPELELAEAAQAAAEDRLATAEEADADWQHRWQTLSEQLAEPKRQIDVERTRASHAEAQVKRLEQTLTRLQQERDTIDLAGVAAAIETLTVQADEQATGLASEQTDLTAVQANIETVRGELKSLQTELAQQRSEYQQRQGRLASLEALQQAALGKDSTAVSEWLAAQGLTDAPRLGELLTTEPGWEQAVEVVLGDSLQAICVNSIEPYVEHLQPLADTSLVLFEIGDKTPAEASPDQLTHKLDAPSPLLGLLAGIMTVDDTNLAMTARNKLHPGQSLITPDGLWFGPDWLRIGRGEDISRGLLAREQTIRLERGELSRLAALQASLAETVSQAEEQLNHLETVREQSQAEVNATHRQLAETTAQLTNQQRLQEQLQTWLQTLNDTLAEQTEECETQRAVVAATEERCAMLGASVTELELAMENLTCERDQLRLTLTEARQQAREQRDAAHQLAVTLEGLSRQMESTQQGIDRLHNQIAQAQAHRKDLLDTAEQEGSPIPDLTTERDRLVEQRHEAEQALADAKAKVKAIETAVHDHDKARALAEQALEAIRAHVDRWRMAWQEADVRRRSLLEQLTAEAIDVSAEQACLPEQATVAQWQETIDNLERRIKKLGNINLGAIDEYRELSERKTYLDEQHADLAAALKTLEEAIQKIDRETRNRFQTTFDTVNEHLKTMFLRLFGGGTGYLEMTSDDLLSTGIVVMARPPGKRLSNIQLMSGGEKALTAVAVVFSIFQLNPAPFCMLDEVDAPLDEANVGRFCDLVRDMSKWVQFIMITHNKTTMELADHLIGITMREPGVSRPVSVDVEAAARMATG